MKIKRFYMENWLNDHSGVLYNLGESGYNDFNLGEFLDLCGEDLASFVPLSLGNNDTKGSYKFRAEISASYNCVNPSDIMTANGSSEVIFALFNTLLNKGDEVAIPFPAFQSLYQVPEAIGCNVKYLNLLEMKNWRLDLYSLIVSMMIFVPNSQYLNL